MNEPRLYDLAAEAAFLGAALVQPAAVYEHADLVLPEHFHRPAHGHVWAAIRDLWARGEPADPVTVWQLLVSRQLNRAVDENLLNDVVAAVPSTRNAGSYARIVVDKALLRSLRTAGTEIADLASSSSDAAAAVDAAEHAIYQLSDKHRPATAVHLGPTLPAWRQQLANLERTPGVPTGFHDLDALLLGLHPGQLVVIAGRPGMGKSTYAAAVATNAARQGHPTLFCSLEMSLAELQNRWIASAAKVSLQDIRAGRVADKDWQRIDRAIGELAGLPLDVDDNASSTTLTLRAQARRTASRHGRLDLIVVDYVQLMKPLGRHGNREGEVAEVARGLKLLARDLGVPVVALAQLNRGLEQRADKRPLLSDLRESGELENAADVVVFLYRDDYYNPASNDKGACELIVAKQRNGPTDTVRVAYHPAWSAFSNMMVVRP